MLSFSQNTSNKEIIVLEDSTNTTYIAFDEKAITQIIEDLKKREIDKKLMKEYEKKLREYQDFLIQKNEQVDSIRKQNKLAYQIIIGKDKIITFQEKEMDIMKGIIKDYEKKDLISQQIITEQKKDIKKKNNILKVLGATNIVTIAVIILLIL